MRALTQGSEVNTIRPVAPGIDDAILTLVGNEKLVTADVGLDSRQRLGDWFIGKAPRKQPKLVVHGILC